MILVTGAAGFIGFHVSLRLLEEGHSVLGLDNLNAYYDVSLKEARNRVLQSHPCYVFHKIDVTDAIAVQELFEREKPEHVLHFAAQAGVRYSLINPRSYAESNLMGFLNVLEACRPLSVKHLIYASSSSVYGLDTAFPLSIHQATNHPVSFYAATKKANELMAHSYSHLFGIPTSGLRLFTVYGPWGRPDMALFSFTKAILADQPIDVFGCGMMRRDFTYIDDVVEAVVKIIRKPPASDPTWNSERPDPATSSAPYRIYNIGNRSTVEVRHMIEILEACLGKKATKRFIDAQACEVDSAIADTSDLAKAIGYEPSTSLEVGIGRFVDWYREYHAS